MKKFKDNPEFERKVREFVFDLWQTFNESPEGREKALGVFDEFKKFSAKRPRVVEYWEGIKQSFLKAEVENEQN